MSKHLVIIPRISEKTFAQAQKARTYTFDVPLTANKQQIAAAVAQQYDVTVTTVNVVIAKGKVKRTVRRGGAATVKGQRKDVKKAYVTLAEGNAIKMFEEEQ